VLSVRRRPDKTANLMPSNGAADARSARGDHRALPLRRHPVRISGRAARDRVLPLRELQTKHLSTFRRLCRHRQEFFRYARGTPVGYASSPGVERTHCGRCGSPISFENSKDFALWVGALDDPTKVTPTYHCHTAEQLPWVEIADELPRYEFRSHKATPLSHGPSGRSGR
jgi:hypothetical protein